MRVRYDRSCDAAYLYLRAIEPGGVARTTSVGRLNLDFDGAGLLVGIEAIQASQVFPAELLATVPTTGVRIDTVEALPGYRLRLGLSDGRTVERDLSDLVPGPDAHPDNVFLPWRDPAYFARVFLPAEPWPTATWPNGADICPDVLICGVDADGNLLAPPEDAAR